MEFAIKIKRVENGYILTYFDEETNLEKIVAIEDCNNFNCAKRCEQETLKKVLHEITEYFGIYSSKHNATNLYIGIKKNRDCSTDII